MSLEPQPSRTSRREVPRRDIKFTIRLTELELEHCEIEAATKGMTVTDWMRRKITRGMKR